MNTKIHPVCIAGAGICCLDHILVTPPVEWGHSVFAEKYFIQGGGLVATAIVACSHLGAQTLFYSLLGDDSNSKLILAGLKEEGIDTTQIRISPGGLSPFSFVHVNQNTAERTIFHHPPQNLTGLPINLLRISSCQALLVDDTYLELAIAASEIAHDFSVPVIADLSPSPHNEELLRKVDVLIAPSQFVGNEHSEVHLKKALEQIHLSGPETALITLGSHGWIASDKTGVFQGKAFPVPVVDTLGAGDVFHGAFAFALAQQWDTPRCAEFASAVAALKCTQPGGRTGIPNLPDTLSFLKKNSPLGWNDISLYFRGNTNDTTR